MREAMRDHDPSPERVALYECLHGMDHDLTLHTVFAEKLEAIFLRYRKELVRRLLEWEALTDCTLDEWLNNISTRSFTLDNLSQDEAYALYEMAQAAKENG